MNLICLVGKRFKQSLANTILQDKRYNPFYDGIKQ
jgi:hypothetical protein